MTNDPYIWMENLDDPRTRDFIESENKRFREFIGDLPKEFEDEVKKYFYKTTLVHAMLASDGFFALLREKDKYFLQRFYFGEKDAEKF